MRLRLAAVIPLCAATLLGCTRGSSRPAEAAGEALVLEDVTLIDGTGSPPRPHVTLLIRDGRLREIYPHGTRPAPPGARTLPVAGRFVIPGLIDSHVHLATFDRGEIYPALLRHTLLGGVTTVRDMGGNTARVAELAAGGRTGPALAPRIYYSAVVAGPRWFATYDTARIRYWSSGRAPGSAPGVRLLERDGQIDGIVREARAMGATGIKVYSDVPPARLAALVRSAHRAGLKVWAHAVVPPTRPEQIVASGVDAVSHADQVVWSGAPAADPWDRAARGELFRTLRPDDAPYQGLYRAMRERGVLFEPTLLVMQMGAPARNAASPVSTLDTVPRWSVGAARAAFRAGVRLLAGTDAIGRETPNIHSELQLLVRQVGMPPVQAIQAATQHGAIALGAQDSIGTVSPGKLADLVVLRADPSADIRNTQTIEFVIQGGRVLPRTEGWEAPQFAELPPAR